jgi:hypothetical protein
MTRTTEEEEIKLTRRQLWLISIVVIPADE